MKGEDVGMMRAMDETRQGSWMETHSGTRFYPLDPRPSEVYLTDVAWHLGRINRYGGAIKLEQYSVAEHAVEMAKWFIRTYPDEPHVAFQALHHDDCEAYIGDMVRPLKRELPQFTEVEINLWDSAIAPRFGLPTYAELDPRVKDADNRILVDERAQVMNQSLNTWGIDHLEPLGVRLHGLRPSVATNEFLALHARLSEKL